MYSIFKYKYNNFISVEQMYSVMGLNFSMSEVVTQSPYPWTEIFWNIMYLGPKSKIPNSRGNVKWNSWTLETYSWSSALNYKPCSNQQVSTIAQNAVVKKMWSRSNSEFTKTEMANKKLRIKPVKRLYFTIYQLSTIIRYK